MGKKGDKLTQQSVLAAETILHDLSVIKDVTSKKMFGGHGIFHEDKMFGIIDSKGQAFLKADDTNMADFEAYDSKKHSRMPYYAIPIKVLRNKKELVQWANKSIRASKKTRT